MATRIPPPPAGFALEEAAPRRAARPVANEVPPPPPGFVLEGAEAHDGDTIHAQEQRVRLYGVDAPELGQLGYDRGGNAVPIGEQSRDFLQAEIDSAENVSFGGVEGTSYGRLVGPVTADGTDIGLAAVRGGNAVAAPSYVRDDPAYSFDLMEAERLARLNHLGPMNDTMARDPAEQRHNPDWQPDRETIAQFWDSPTPFAGMRPEAEKEYLGLQARGTADQIVAFARQQGLDMDPAQVAKWVAWRDEQKAAGKPFQNYANYQRGPEVIQQVGDGAFRAAGRGFAQGFLAGGLDEAGAVADTLLPNIPGLMTNGPRENIWNSDRRLADIWAANEFQNASILRGDDYAHPYATTGGEIAGGLTSGIVLPYGAGARTAAELARVGAAYGALGGFLSTDGGVVERTKGAVIGAPVGAVLNAGMGKLIQAALPLFRRNAATVARDAVDGSLPNAARDPLKLIQERQAAWPDVMRRLEAGETEVEPAAVFHPDLGDIDMRWGQAGDPEKNYQNGYGLAHILAKHGEEGILPDLPERIAGMKVVEVNPRGKDRVNLEGPGGRAAVATTWHGDQQNWVLTAFDPDWRPPHTETSTPSAIGEGPDSVLRGGSADVAQGGLSINEGIEPARTIGMEAEPLASVSGTPPTGRGARRLLDPADDAERAAVAGRIEPSDVLPIASNEIDGPEEAAAVAAGRFAEAKAPNERQELSRGTVRAWNGAEVPKVGPTDMVGWLRLRGGLKDQGGELSHMGLTNAARRGLDHVGQEARFGPLVNNESGANLDDAALAAWEAGYFPEHSERPSVNEFLDALRDTHNGGTGRRFLPEDLPELERFEAARGERYDLEQQQNEAGKIWQDRSMPGDDAAPFPPPEAYEDWGSSAPDFAGNIRLEKLDTPQDIARALAQTEKRVGFDAATRGRVTQAETERLAAEMNMTPEQLLSRRKGQALNAEQALAARQILAKSGNELVNLARRVRSLEEPGDELLAEFRRAWLRHAAIQEQVAGATAEAGRALGQFRMAANSRAVRGEVLSAFVRGGGGNDRMQDAANALLDAVEVGPGQFNSLAEKLTKPKWRDKISEFYINMLLSNPPTHIVNMVSNTATAIGQIPEYATASMIGAARRAVLGKGVSDRILASEVGARSFGLVQGAKEGFALFGRALRSGEPDDFVSKVEGQQFKAIDGFKGEVIRLPTRLLTAEDQLFKGVARRMAINGLSMRQAAHEGLKGEELTNRVAELVANPPDHILHAAMDEGLYRTFQTKLGETGQALSKFTNSNLLAKVIIPFVRTPINLLKFATERSPAAPLLKEWRADFLAGGERRDLATAKVLLGTGFMASVYSAAQNGMITGAVPPDPKKAKLLYADGWQPYSIKVGDRYISYSRLDPLATTIGVAADMATLPSGLSEKQRDNMAVMLVASVMGNLASKTWLSGASAFTEALADPGRSAEKWLERTASAFAVPAVVAGAARAIDPVARERDGVSDAIQARIPGLSDNLLPQRDIFGEPVVGNNLGPDFLSPFWTSKSKNDPVVAEMLRIDKGVSAPGKQYTEDGERVDYTPEEYDRYSEIAGRLTYNQILALIGSDAYRAADDNGRRKAAKKAIAQARKDARKVIDDPNYRLPGKGVAPETPPLMVGERRSPVMPPPAGFEMIEGKPGDPLVDLRSAIPGINATSGFRDKAYQAEMRRKGYRPAANSAHLDGDSIDVTPPKGRSMNWLAVQVRKARPDARILNEGDHLHLTFSGWGKAPALGPAEAEGVFNPALIPPPPAGFQVTDGR